MPCSSQIPAPRAKILLKCPVVAWNWLIYKLPSARDAMNISPVNQLEKIDQSDSILSTTELACTTKGLFRKLKYHKIWEYKIRKILHIYSQMFSLDRSRLLVRNASQIDANIWWVIVTWPQLHRENTICQWKLFGNRNSLNLACTRWPIGHGISLESSLLQCLLANYLERWVMLINNKLKSFKYHIQI